LQQTGLKIDSFGVTINTNLAYADLWEIVQCIIYKLK
jgi:hypothetical protein